MNIEPALSASLNFLFPSDIYCAACGNYIDGTRPYALCDVCVREIAWHAGDTCAVCGKALAPHRTGGVCHDCRAWGRSFDAGISCCAYTGRARDLVRAMKYKDSAWIAAKLADAMYDRWRQLAEIRTESEADAATYGRDAFAQITFEDETTEAAACERGGADRSGFGADDFDRSHLMNKNDCPVLPPQVVTAGPSVVIPVPMTEAKRRTRGYDQAEVIARRLAQLIGAPFAGDILRRTRGTAVMSGLGMAERRANMADAFEADPYAIERRQEQTPPRAPERSPKRTPIRAPEPEQTPPRALLEDVLLIDDVFTTGSTADACSLTLKEAGAKRVTLFTFAAGADTDPRSQDSDQEMKV
jgi:predicted amidophosphoribosyltransferase